jgi:hypothetical protein
MKYFTELFAVAFIMSGIWAQYKGYKFSRYCREKYPEVYSDFWSLGTFSHTKVLFNKYPDINDPEFIRLKNGAKNAGIAMAVVFLEVF